MHEPAVRPANGRGRTDAQTDSDSDKKTNTPNVV